MFMKYIPCLGQPTIGKKTNLIVCIEVEGSAAGAILLDEESGDVVYTAMDTFSYDLMRVILDCSLILK